MYDEEYFTDIEIFNKFKFKKVEEVGNSYFLTLEDNTFIIANKHDLNNFILTKNN